MFLAVCKSIGNHGDPLTCEADKFSEIEYKALRVELERRSSIRYQLLLAIFSIFGILLGLQAEIEKSVFPIILLFPVVQYLLVELWAHNYKRTLHISEYIIKFLEPAGGGWELRMVPKSSEPKAPRFAIRSSAARQIFISGAFSICVGVVSLFFQGSYNFAVSALAVCTAIVFLAVSLWRLNKVQTYESRNTFFPERELPKVATR